MERIASTRTSTTGRARRKRLRLGSVIALLAFATSSCDVTHSFYVRSPAPVRVMAESRDQWRPLEQEIVAEEDAPVFRYGSFGVNRFRIPDRIRISSRGEVLADLERIGETTVYVDFDRRLAIPAYRVDQWFFQGAPEMRLEFPGTPIESCPGSDVRTHLSRLRRPLAALPLQCELPRVLRANTRRHGRLARNHRRHELCTRAADPGHEGEAPGE